MMARAVVVVAERREVGLTLNKHLHYNAQRMERGGQCGGAV
jgi:hypothetical protein